ncbi:hypothetical protein NGF19_29140 [Streptomyces sp. RY43-2]|uniref:Uncharacterized protein n=1 Tax=Streptomyces macrolidinus TaxID=2952607 RepID=A0ABT0ZMN7_9ACTN|nr:hypothetical protein [Streptomyces macrolidinus]MCN9244800.1 hypothetical protein [Streptomyces macrolidinus]
MTSTDVVADSPVFDTLELSDTHWSARHRGQEDGGPLPGDRLPGTDSLDLMLRPPQGLTGLNVRATGHHREAGRTIVEFNGSGPGLDPDADVFEEFTTRAPQLAVLGADAYRLEVDAASGIVLGWQALASGVPVSGAALHDLDTRARPDDPAEHTEQ